MGGIKVPGTGGVQCTRAGCHCKLAYFKCRLPDDVPVGKHYVSISYGRGKYEDHPTNVGSQGFFGGGVSLPAKLEHAGRSFWKGTRSGKEGGLQWDSASGKAFHLDVAPPGACAGLVP